MSMSDPIADMLTRIRNAGKAKHQSLIVPASKFKVKIAETLRNNGYIQDFKFEEDNKQGLLTIYLRYYENKHSIYGIKKISKPGRRIYVKFDEINPVLNGLGIAILSTSKGIMTDKEAIKAQIGGEIICEVW